MAPEPAVRRASIHGQTWVGFEEVRNFSIWLNGTPPPPEWGGGGGVCETDPQGGGGVLSLEKDTEGGPTARELWLL